MDHIRFVIVPVCFCDVGSQAGEKDSSLFLNFSETMTFYGKEYPHKTKKICLVMRFSPETTKKTNMKKNSPTA